MPGILAIIPAYNCEVQIRRVIRRFDRGLLAKLREVIVIDNHSEDRTRDAAADEIKKAGCDHFHVWSNHQNYGLGGSFKIGLNYAVQEGFEWLLIIHGDDQASPGDAHLLMDAVTQEASLDAVFGSRFMPSSTRSSYSRVRTLGNQALNRLYTKVTGHPISDIGSGLNLYRVSALTAIGALDFPDHIAFDLRILLGLIQPPGRIHFVPIQWSESDQRSNASNIAVGLAAVKTLLRWKLGLRQARGTPVESMVSTRIS